MSETEIELDRYISMQRNVYVKPENILKTWIVNSYAESIIILLNPFYKTYKRIFSSNAIEW